MSNEELKELIYGLGDILKVDKQFIKKKSINKKKLEIYNEYDFLLNLYDSLDELNKLAESIKLK
jgi:hypothetical protein